MHDNGLDPDDEYDLDDDEAKLSEEDFNAHTLEIRRADGTAVVALSALGSGQQWAVYMQPGGKVQNAYLGEPGSPSLWVDTNDGDITRDDDGTYVITID